MQLFGSDAMRSQLFGSAPKPIMKSLAHKPVTINFHWECVTPENFVQFGLNNSYKLLATSFDPVANLTYVAAVEGINYPFFAVQYHPEKNIYEWTTREKLPHSREAVETAQYLAMFFVDQGIIAKQSIRKNICNQMFNSKLINFFLAYFSTTQQSFIQYCGGRTSEFNLQL